MRLLNLLFAPAAAYQILALIAAVRFGIRSRPAAIRKSLLSATLRPPISVLKPVRGVDPNTYAAFVSQARQRYEQFEILFGVRDPADPVVAQIERLQREYPHTDIRLIHTATDAMNAKVGTLIELSRHARYPVWVVNDGDIRVTPDYLAVLAAQLEDEAVGVVTCPYRASVNSTAAAWESLGIAADFTLGVLVADVLGLRDYGLGATLAFRARDWKAVGGFEAIADFIADDYQVGHRLAKHGKPALLCPYVVETALGDDTWAGVWNHQLRWSRTIRVSKPGSFLGLPIAFAGLWAAVACAAGAWTAAAALLLLRWLSAAVGTLALRNGGAARLFWLAPLWDLYAFALWFTSYLDNKVRWRDRVLRIAGDGRIVS